MDSFSKSSLNKLNGLIALAGDCLGLIHYNPTALEKQR